MYNNTTGNSNNAYGHEALFANTTGNYNVAIGEETLYTNSSGNNNIALGCLAGFNITNGSYNIDIGNQGAASDAYTIRIGDIQTQAFIAGVITGNGGGLTNLNIGQLPNAVVTNNENNVALTGTFAGNGAGLTNLQIGQLSGAVLTNNASGVTLNGSFSGDGSGLVNTVTAANYVSAYDITTHINGTANAFQSINFTAASLSGWTYVGGGAGNFICPQSGMYLVQYTAEAETIINSATTISLRAFNLATDFEIPGSESSIILSVANQPVPISKSFLTYLSSGTSIQFQFTGNNTSAELVGGIGAATYQPSISCTIVRIQ